MFRPAVAPARRGPLVVIFVACLVIPVAAFAGGSVATGDATGTTDPGGSVGITESTGTTENNRTTGSTETTATAGTTAVVGTAGSTSVSGPRIVSVYPNPFAAEDAGEHAVVGFPDSTDLSAWTLTDGESNVSLPNRTVSGRVALTAEPDAAANLTDHTVVGLAEFPSLANGGDELRLVRGDTTVDEVVYTDASEGERGRLRVGNEPASRNGSTKERVEWTPLGATDFEAVRTGSAAVRTFSLPDAPDVPLDMIESADERVLLAGYTFGSERVATALQRAHERGVEVQVLVDDAPAGGITARQFDLLDSLAASGIAVEVFGGERARYDYYHPKYTVVDDRALVMTENWKPSGTGGESNRGWGAVVQDEAAASRLAELFRADAGWRDTTSWETFRAGRTGVEEEHANGDFSTRFEPRNATAENVRLLAAPDNAEHAVVSLLDNATDSARIIQAGIGSRRQPFLRAAIRAAERGVDVKVLLSSAWYSEEENRAMAAWINRRADRGNLSLSAKVAQPNGRFEKIHAKGLIVDGDQAVVGSLNWNNNSARDNREVALVLSGESVAGYYESVFAADWEGGNGDGGSGFGDWLGEQPLPVGVIVAVTGIIVLALLVARKIRFLE